MKFRAAIDAVTGEMYLPVEERGRLLLEEPLLNKGTAFTPQGARRAPVARDAAAPTPAPWRSNSSG